MLRFFLLIFVVVIGYAAYIDISHGSLPFRNTAKANNVNSIPYYVKEIKPGDTVLSLVEKTEDSLPVAIEDIISDFEELNDGLSPEKILIGRSYNIPDY